MEEKNENKNLKVSDCHTGNFTKNKVEDVDGATKEVTVTWINTCDVCGQPCKVVEMIVDSIEASKTLDLHADNVIK